MRITLLLLLLPQLLFSDALAVYVSNKETRPVKTRLAKGTSSEVATNFYEHSLNVLTEDLQALSNHFTIIIAPTKPEDAQWAKKRWPDYEILPQIQSPNLGDRIQFTVNTLLENGHKRVLLIGSDAPSLPIKHIDTCLASLKADTVLGPADDGGFYLIGSQKPLPDLTLIRWSSPYAHEDTQKTLLNAGLTHETGPFWYDIDTAEDLWRLEQDLDPSSPARLEMRHFLRSLTKVSIIIPVLNEEDNIAPIVSSLKTLDPEPQLLIVDGGSQDQTVVRIQQSGLTPLISTPPNRGRQLNTGIAHAKGQVLLFLHADTRIDQQSYLAMLEALEDPKCTGGAFRYTLEEKGWKYRVIETGVKWRNALYKLPYGDQGYFIKKQALEKVGLFREIRLMEDIEWFVRLKNAGSISLLEAPAYTSPRRIFARGWVRSAAVNLILVALYKLGADPEELANFYYRKDQRPVLLQEEPPSV